MFNAEVMPDIFDEVLAQELIDIKKYVVAVEMETKLSSFWRSLTDYMIGNPSKFALIAWSIFFMREEFSTWASRRPDLRG